MKWSEEEKIEAIEFLKKGNTYEEIAIVLSRTGKSVKEKLNELGYVFENYSENRYYEDKECKHCKNKFKALKKHNRLFCTQSCSTTYNNIKKNKNKKCLKCDEILIDKPSKAKFCSKYCSSSYNSLLNTNHNNGYTKKRAIVISKCLNCETEIKDKKEGRKFCDLKCQHNYEWYLKKESIKKGEVNSNKALRKYMIEKDGHKCQICEETVWNNKEIPLVLDHMDGNSYNNLPVNLRMICPNCDAQTETYKGKNKGKGRHERMKRYYDGKSF